MKETVCAIFIRYSGHPDYLFCGNSDGNYPLINVQND
jgi:hypothetical protein